jgi:hypothetical protein
MARGKLVFACVWIAWVKVYYSLYNDYRKRHTPSSRLASPLQNPLVLLATTVVEIGIEVRSLDDYDIHIGYNEYPFLDRWLNGHHTVG